MTHRHGPADLLGPEDTIRLDHDGHHDDGHRPRVVAALGELPGDEPVLNEAVHRGERVAGRCHDDGDRAGTSAEGGAPGARAG